MTKFVAEMTMIVIDVVENIIRKGENGGNKLFLLCQ